MNQKWKDEFRKHTGESFDTIKPTKVFNPRKYTELYATLSNAELKAKAEATYIAYNLKHNYSEDFFEKVKNFGKNLWRAIKELLGKLIIFIEEQIAYLFDKTRVADKTLKALAKAIGNITRWGTMYNNGAISFVPGVSGDGETLPDSIDDVRIDWFSGANVKLDSSIPLSEFQKLVTTVQGSDINQLYQFVNSKSQSDTKVYDFSEIINGQIELHNIPYALFRTFSYWKSNQVSKDKKLHQLSKAYSTVAKSYNQVMSLVKKDENLLSGIGMKLQSKDGKDKDRYTGLFVGDNQELDISIGGDGKFTEDANSPGDAGSSSESKIIGIVDPRKKKPVKESKTPVKEDLTSYKFGAAGLGNAENNYMTFINAGLLLEGVEVIVENRMRSREVTSLLISKQLLINDSNIGPMLSENVVPTARKILLSLMYSMLSYKLMRDIYFDFKRFANQLKNAPTEITDNFSSETCQGVRLVISRSTKAAHKLLKDTEHVMTTYIDMGLRCSEVLTKLNKHIETASDAHAIRAK